MGGVLFFNQKIFKTVIRAGILFSCLIWATTGQGFETREIGVVATDRLNMRRGAGTGYPVIKVLEKDVQVRVLAHEGDWLQIIHESDVGYIANRGQYIKLYTIHSVSDGRQTDLDIARTRAKEIEQKVRQQTEEVARYDRKEKQIIDALHKTDLALSNIRQQITVMESGLAAVAGRISDMQKQVDQAQQTIDRRSGYAVNRLISIYKLHKLGELNLLASATSLYDLMQRRSAIEKILKYDYQVISRMAAEKNHLSALVHALNVEKNKKENLNQAHRAAAAELEKEKKQRQDLLAQIKQKKTNRLATIKYLKNASIQLDKTIHALNAESGPDQQKNNNFYAYQGLLKIPVDGKVISKFGKYIEPRSGISNFRNGIEIESRPGAPIRAVFSGQTIYSSWLKGYGNVIIIAHGKEYHTVYAHAEELFRAKGEKVETGEVIATVGDTGSMTGPSLYFEIRHQGNPVDPLEWINKS